tara:strand:- start:55 stop:480 length:426 start_codon:yes stop_codon:yes gene_type:complete
MLVENLKSKIKYMNNSNSSDHKNTLQYLQSEKNVEGVVSNLTPTEISSVKEEIKTSNKDSKWKLKRFQYLAIGLFPVVILCGLFISRFHILFHNSLEWWLVNLSITGILLGFAINLRIIYRLGKKIQQLGVLEAQLRAIKV